MTLNGYHATDRAIRGPLYARTWFSTCRDAVEFYWSGSDCGTVIYAEVTLTNPLHVSADEFREAYPHGPTWFLQQAAEGGFDSVVIHDIQDGDRVSTVFATVGEPDYLELNREGAE